MARASGSYPAGRWFKSDIRYHSRPVGQAVKTRPFHGCNMGSIPVRVTMKKDRHPDWTPVFFHSSTPSGSTHPENRRFLGYGFAFDAGRSASSLVRRRASKYSPRAKFPYVSPNPRKHRRSGAFFIFYY